MCSTCQLISCTPGFFNSVHSERIQARLAQSVERKALNLVVVGSSPTVGVTCDLGMSWLRLSTDLRTTAREHAETRAGQIALPMGVGKDMREAGCHPGVLRENQGCS